MAKAGNKKWRNSLHGVADRQISGSPNNVNASEGNNDQELIIALRVLPICLLVRKHFRLKD